MAQTSYRQFSREIRKIRVRRKVIGTSERPRMCVFRSLRHVYAQLIEDSSGLTIVSASTLDKDVRAEIKSGGNIDAAKKVGELIAKKALEKNIEKAVFDRNGFIYHGRIKAVAEGARSAGLKF